MTNHSIATTSRRAASDVPEAGRRRLVTLQAEPLRSPVGPATISVDARATAISRTQQGVCTRRQLRGIGISARSIHRRVTAGAWQEHPGGVLALGTHERTWEQDLAIALLAAGADEGKAWASHLTAGYLHGLLDIAAPRRLDITVPRDRRPRCPSARLHRARSLPKEQQALIRGMPSTSLPRTLLDLSATLPPPQLEPILWEACRGRPKLPLELAGLLDRSRYLRGRTVLTALLAGLHPQTAEAGSPLEIYGLLAIRDPLLPPPVLQYRVRDRLGRVVRRVDAAWPSVRVALEFDGNAYHRSPSRIARDARQRGQLRELGWIVIEVRHEDLSGERLRELRAELRQLVAPR
jgi:very-short-patch-repair endonuclease